MDSDNDIIRIQVIDSNMLSSGPIDTKIPLRELREYMDDKSNEIKELWFDFQNKEGTKIRILFNYLYSKQFMYDSQCGEWRTQLQEDVQDYRNIKNYLAQLQNPYAFLDSKKDREEEIGMSFEEIELEAKEKDDFKKNHPWIHKFEKNIID